MNPVLRGAAAHVFVDDLRVPLLGEADAHHLTRVLRLRPGDVVTLGDGRGAWTAGRVVRGGELEVTGEAVHGPPAKGLTVACALVKGDRNDLVVQKLTEIGIDRILLFEAERSVVRWDAERRARQVERLQRIAREAAMQSRRLHLPTIDIVPFAEVVRVPGVAAAEPGADRRIDGAVRAVAIGPEGGFSDDELERFGDRVRLTGTVLRAETAAIVAGAALVAAHE